GHASDRGFDDVLNISHGEAIARDRLAVGNDVDVLAASLALREGTACPRHLAQHAFEGDADPFNLPEVRAEYLDSDGGPHTGSQHVDARPNRWRDRHLIAGHAKRGIQSRDSSARVR